MTGTNILESDIWTCERALFCIVLFFKLGISIQYKHTTKQCNIMMKAQYKTTLACIIKHNPPEMRDKHHWPFSEHWVSQWSYRFAPAGLIASVHLYRLILWTTHIHTHNQNTVHMIRLLGYECLKVYADQELLKNRNKFLMCLHTLGE